MRKLKDFPSCGVPRDGFGKGWLAYDRRTFGDILTQWQEHVSPEDVPGFIRVHLHLEHDLTTADITALVSGEKAPAAALASYLSALVPPEVASGTVFRNRGFREAARGDRPSIAFTGVA